MLAARPRCRTSCSRITVSSTWPRTSLCLVFGRILDLIFPPLPCSIYISRTYPSLHLSIHIPLLLFQLCFSLSLISLIMGFLSLFSFLFASFVLLFVSLLSLVCMYGTYRLCLFFISLFRHICMQKSSHIDICSRISNSNCVWYVMYVHLNFDSNC